MGVRTREFRITGLYQHDEPSRAEQAAYMRSHPADTSPGMTAREWFSVLRLRTRAAQLTLEPEKQVKHDATKRVISYDKEGKKVVTIKKVKQIQIIPAVLAAPTFKNIINAEGQHV